MHKLIHDLRLPKNVAQQFISDVMGSPSNLECGLLDAEDEEMFYAQLHSVEEVWNKTESECTGQHAVFMTGL